VFNSEDGALVLCGARSKRNEGRACRQPAMKNGRCRLHGGKSTGPKTEEGRKKSKIAVLKHGFYSLIISRQKETILQFYKLLKFKN
jgi:hypothetical protein